MNKCNFLKLKSCPKSYTIGTHRSIHPEQTLNCIEPKIKVVGITRIANITGLDRVGIPIYSCVRPRAAKGAISVYSGKGLVEVHSKVSAIMEAIERYSAEVTPEDQLKFARGSFKDLSSKHNVLNPTELILPFNSFYKPEVQLKWVKGWDLIQNEEIFVPVSSVFHPYYSQDDLHLFKTNTNGLASGNTLEEAILHGLLEVIERDAWSLIELTRADRKVIEKDSRLDLIHNLREKFEKNEIDIILKDITSDLDIPVVAAISDDKKLMDPALLTLGFGAHLDPQIATIRALTEVAQSRVVQIQGAREDTHKAILMRKIGYDTIKKINKHWFSDVGDSKELQSLQNLAKNDILDEILFVISVLKKKGIKRVIVVDLTKEEVEVPTVRVIVPNLEVYGLDSNRIGSRGKRSIEEGLCKKKL